MRVPGRLSHFTQAWSTITSDSFILSIISGYKIPFLSIPVQYSEPPEFSGSDSDIFAMAEAVNHLLNIGAIRKCNYTKGQFVSSIFLVPKSNGKKRLILNLKKLNFFIDTSHFKLEDIRTVLKLITKGYYMASIDQQDAYLTIPVHKNFCKYLRFRWEGQLYEYVCLPFGICTGPWVFTKITKPIVNYLRSLGWLSVVYLDDWWLIHKTLEGCSENIKITIKLLESLGFVINKDKSELIPSTTCQFLGFILNSDLMTIELTPKKREHILELIKKFKSLDSCVIREFACFVGNITAACPAVNYGWFHSKIFEQQKYLSLLNSHDNYDAVMQLNQCLEEDFSWWENNILTIKNPIRQSNYQLTIFSDASLTGWGASCDNKVVFGQWDSEERSLHINCLELIAAFNGLKSFAKELSECEILLKIDNSTAIAYINKMGGPRYKNLNNITRKIWSWCEERNLWLFAAYIPSQGNVIADAASRSNNIDTEWELASLGL